MSKTEEEAITKGGLHKNTYIEIEKAIFSNLPLSQTILFRQSNPSSMMFDSEKVRS